MEHRHKVAPAETELPHSLETEGHGPILSLFSASFFKKHVSTLTLAKADHLLEIMVVNIKILCFIEINLYTNKMK